MRKEVEQALLKHNDPDYKAIYDGEILVLDCLTEICKCMKDKGLSNKQMAKTLKLSLHYWDSVLADSSISVRLLGQIASRLGMKTIIKLEPKDD